MTTHAKRTNMTDKDNVNIEVFVALGQYTVNLNGHYNIRTNMIHLNPTEEQNELLEKMGTDSDKLTFDLEERRIELH